ncbi:MAG TPA: aminotransferase class V-fold PLP-dependent enzyme [Puia sp.]|nr:aminotransferase class V-fold PLP-dependent enzyme [Puia sp.]
MADSPFTEKEILRYRGETPGCGQVIHLNNAGAALMPAPVIDEIIAHIRLEGNIGGYEAAGLVENGVHEFYVTTGRLLNCAARNIAFCANATDAFTRALSAVPFQEGDVLLTCDDEYVSNQIGFLSIARRIGIEVKRVRTASVGGVDLDDLDRQLKKWHPRLLSITHVPTNSGLVQPLDEIAGIIRNYDTLFLLDACQSAGQLPLDVAALGCDFLSSTCRKFLRGPRGAGFLYVSDKALASGLEPLFIEMNGADWIEKDRYRAHEDASRFQAWESAYAILLGSGAAIQYCLDVGVERINQRLKYLASYTRNALSKIEGLRLLDKGPALCSIITFTIEGIEAKDLQTELLSRAKINVVRTLREYAVIDFDRKGVTSATRVSPHYYNTESEIDRLTACIEEILSDRI